ncbi:hypothetical protein NE237_012215 [Protea cynaroides]|uniref:Uncharacterized protein n=1 Tax=Protea cynaroides TaxID=273540 RepID=A0A9Q0GWG2_9MAGN|nr:hypothetical protein NE237_012215 [Protea cynaroides]
MCSTSSLLPLRHDRDGTIGRFSDLTGPLGKSAATVRTGAGWSSLVGHSQGVPCDEPAAEGICCGGLTEEETMSHGLVGTIAICGIKHQHHSCWLVVSNLLPPLVQLNKACGEQPSSSLGTTQEQDYNIRLNSLTRACGKSSFVGHLTKIEPSFS